METKEINGVMLIMSVAEYEAEIEKRVQARLNEMPNPKPLFKVGDRANLPIREVENEQPTRNGCAYLSGTITAIDRNNKCFFEPDECDIRIVNISDLQPIETNLKPSVNYDAIKATLHVSGERYIIWWKYGEGNLNMDLLYLDLAEDKKLIIHKTPFSFAGRFDYLEFELKTMKLNFHQTAEYCRKRIAEIIFESIALK